MYTVARGIKPKSVNSLSHDKHIKWRYNRRGALMHGREINITAERKTKDIEIWNSTVYKPI